MNASTNHPLDTLVVSNLAELISTEKLLSERYSRFSQTAEFDSQERLTFSSELAALRNKADRLHRMIVAMDQLMSSENAAEIPAVV